MLAATLLACAACAHTRLAIRAPAVPYRAATLTMQQPTPAPVATTPAAQAGPPMGGPPPGTPGGPPGGPPGGGGPPPRTPAQQAVDTIFESVFPLLYAAEPEGMLDSSKNLRVLWVRALLAAAGNLKDPVAKELLPSATRWIVSPPLAKTLWAPVMPKLDWVRQRTEWIDSSLDDFLKASVAGEPTPQVILLGSGYDTRALRYRTAPANFFEVDLPEVLSVKHKMSLRFLDNAPAAEAASERALGVDLNKASGSVVVQLQTKGLNPRARTLVVCEAVLFYLSPPAKRALLAEVGELTRGAPGSALVLADNLAPFVRSHTAARAATSALLWCCFCKLTRTRA